MRLRIAPFAELDTRELYAVLRLRVDVFIVEQGSAYPDLDGRDDEPGTLHAWLEHDGAPAAYLRILADPGGVARIGRVVTDRSHRGGGLSRQLIAAALDRVGHGPVVLDAQVRLAPFYAGFGFGVTGPEFVEDGVPHLPMRRDPA